MNMNHLKVLAAATALSATALVAVPAQAGPFGFLKKIVKKELTELAQETAQSAVDAATGAAVGDQSESKGKKKGKVEASWKVEEGEAAPSGDGGFRQEGGTTVPTADDVQAPQGETRGLLLPAVQPRFQGGVNVAVGDINGDGTSDGPSKPGMSQNGTTVPSADTVQAQQEERRMLLLPAVQKVAPEPRPQTGMTQNGTTVPTADEVQAPQRPQRGKMVQNGTTVEAAGEVQAPEQGE